MNSGLFCSLDNRRGNYTATVLFLCKELVSFLGSRTQLMEMDCLFLMNKHFVEVCCLSRVQPDATKQQI